jgi:predicted AlkP superfamily phosphohydrolase/phosphomutase
LENNSFLKLNNESICWNKTLAFESVQGSHGININIKEKYKEGIVDKKDYEKIRRDIIEYLKSLCNPKTSLPMFKIVIERENVYDGPFCTGAPDIIVETADERFVPLGDNYWATRVHRTNQSGWHRKDGFWTGHGILFNGIKKDASILDIAPTIHSLICEDKNRPFVGKSILC